MMENLAMGGYGPYVWSSVGLTVTVIVICTVQAFRGHRRMLRELRIRNKASEKAER